MELLPEMMKILLTISNAMLYPVLILLIILVALCFVFAGDMISEYSKRSKDFDDKFKGGHLSGFCGAVKRLVAEHRNPSDEDMLSVKIGRLLQEYEAEAGRKLGNTRLLIRVGPMLGLMGTLIPLGPALLGLSAGNIEQLANNLVIAFTSTVVGLLIGAVSLTVASVRQRWYSQDLDDMEYMAELSIAKGGD
ncbi:MAG: MotA/TolQ/ExbB proton channel family protein [Methanosarcinales archaeon]|nr:MotA/TolQ/ExbB proton channel family protein [Methanosarcinales archaeon]